MSEEKMPETVKEYFESIWLKVVRENRPFKVPPVQTYLWDDEAWGRWVATPQEWAEAKLKFGNFN